jgi:hypothetical protein
MPNFVYWAVLSQRDAGSPWTWSFRDVAFFDISRMGALAAGLAVGVLIAWYYSRWFNRRPVDNAPNNPQRLFAELCRAHKLSAAQQRLLEWLASERQLLQPALVFLDPILLESAIAHADSPAVRKRLTELRSRLFAGAENECAADVAQRLQSRADR